MKTRNFTKTTLFLLLAVLLVTLLGATVSARTVFHRSWFVSGTVESLATEPTPGKLSYAYGPESERTGLPGGFSPTYGLDLSDGWSTLPGPDGIPYTADDEENTPRDFSLELTYVLTEEESAAADLSKNPFLGLRMGVSNTANLTLAETFYKVIVYTSTELDEKAEFVVPYSSSGISLPTTSVSLNLTSAAAGFADKTVEKIVIIPFFDVFDRPISGPTGSVYATKFLVQGFGLFDSSNEAQLALFNKITYAEDLSSGTAPDSTIAVVTSLNRVNTKPARLTAMTNWIVANKDALNIKLVPIVGQTTMSVQNYTYTDASKNYAAAGFGSISLYLSGLLADPNLVIPGGTQSSAPIHAAYQNIADAFRQVSEAGIHLSVAYYHMDLVATQTRNHILWDAYFRYSAATVEDYMGAAGNGFSNASYNRININPTGTAGVDFGQYAAAIKFVPDGNNQSGGVKNTWYTFTAGGQDYLAVTLEMHPTRAVRAWFKGLVENNPNKKVIVILTGYMDPAGKLYTIWDDEAKFTLPEAWTTYAAGAELYPTTASCFALWKPSKNLVFNGIVSPGNALAMSYYTTGMQTALWTDATDGDMFWNNYLSRYKNIYLVIDGGETKNSNAAASVAPKADGTALIRDTTSLDYALDVVTREDVGIFGNTVYTVQANPIAYVTEYAVLLLVKLKGDETEISYYIPELDAYVNPEASAFTLDNPPLLIDNPDAPYGLTVSAGEISGLNPAAHYQYRAMGDTEYLDLPLGTAALTGLAMGKYEIRVPYDNVYAASAPVAYFVPDADYAPKPMDWNMNLYSTATVAALTELGYTDANQQTNRNNYFQDVHNVVAKAGTSNTTPGHFIWVQNSTSRLALIGYGTGYYAARSNEIKNNLQYYSYIFRDNETFDVQDRPHLALSISGHGSIALWEDYRRALTEAGVKPTSRVLLYLYGRKEPYEILQTRDVSSAAFETYTTFNVTLPSDLSGYIEKIEIYPMYQYWPEPDSASSTYSDGTSNPADPTATSKWRCHLDVDGTSYEYYIWNGDSGKSAANFYTGYALHLRQLGFYAFAQDAAAVAAAPTATTPSFTRSRFEAWLPSSQLPKAGEFTIAILPNPAFIASDSDKCDALTQWIVDNKSIWNIQMVASVGLHTTAESRYQAYWNTGANYANKFGYTKQVDPEKPETPPATALSNYSTSILYLGSIGGIQLADKTYYTTLRNQAANIANALAKLTAANIPLSVSNAMYDNLGAFSRASLLQYYIDPEDLIQTGRLDTGVSLSAATLNGDANLAKLEADGNVLLKEYYKNLTSFENTYYTFTAQGTDYLVLSMEAWPRKVVRTWANDLLAQNSGKSVIVMMPELYDNTGTAIINCWASTLNPISYSTTFNGAAVTSKIRTFNGANLGDPLEGSEIWRLVLQKHSNVKLIYDAGNHIITFASNVSREIKHHQLLGVNGNTVHVLQGSFAQYCGSVAGSVLLLKFTDGGNAVDAISFVPAVNSYAIESLNHTIVFDTYDVTVDSAVTGIEGITGAAPGQTVTLSVTPPADKKVKVGSLKIAYETDGEFYTDSTAEYLKSYNNSVEKILLADKNGNFSFTMPNADVVVTSVEYIDTAEHNIALSASGIRLDGPQGMRFLATFYLDGIDDTYFDQWSYGVLIIPTHLMTGGDIDLCFESDGSLPALILDIPMINYYYYAISKGTGSGYFHYTGVLNSIPADAGNVDLSAVAYVKYTTDGTTFHYAYSDVYNRTYQDVVESAFLSGKESTANETALDNLLKSFPVE